MAKRMTALLTIAAFVLFTQACTIYSTKQVSPDVAAQKKSEDVAVVRVMKTSGEMIDFEEKNPALIVGDAVIGKSTQWETIEISRDNIKQTSGPAGKITSVTTKDGKTYIPVLSFKETPERVVFTAQRVETIPLSDIKLVWLRERNRGASTLASLGIGASVVTVVAVIAGAIVLVGALKAIISAFCPILYVQDGAALVCEGELYSGAVFKDMERTDYLKLSHLSGQNNALTLIIANEAAQTQNTDEVNLLVADHPQGSSVLIGSDGTIHTIQNPVAAASAVDLKGADFTAALRTPDGRMWSGSPFERNPDDPADLKSGVILRFPKPVEAERAKLVVRIGNTFWADYMFTRCLGLSRDLPARWNQQAAESTRSEEQVEGFIEKGGIALRSQLLRGGQWEDIGYFHPTGPIELQDEILKFSLSGTDSDDLTIKLDGGTFFWMIDYAAVDYSADLAVDIQTLSPLEATDENGHDIRESLLRADGIYHALPGPGNLALLKFPAVPERPALERSFFLKSQGYYTIHASERGRLDPGTILLLQHNSDDFLKSSLREFARIFAAQDGLRQK